MATQGVLVLTAIVSAFVIFGTVLAWADFYTQRGRTSAEDESSAAKRNHQDFLDERRAA